MQVKKTYMWRVPTLPMHNQYYTLLVVLWLLALTKVGALVMYSPSISLDRFGEIYTQKESLLEKLKRAGFKYLGR